METNTQKGAAKTKRKLVSLGWMAVDCNNLVKNKKCSYYTSMHCPLNVCPQIKEGGNCKYAKKKK